MTPPAPTRRGPPGPSPHRALSTCWDGCRGRPTAPSSCNLADEVDPGDARTTTGTGTVTSAAPRPATGPRPGRRRRRHGDGDGDRCAPPRGIYKPRRGERPLWDFPTGPLQAGSGRLRAGRGARLVGGPPHRGAGRPARRGLGPAVHRGRLRAALLHPPGAGGVPLGLPGHLPLRPGGQQHRPQERPLPARPRRPHLGHRQRAVLRHEFKLRTVLWDFAGEPIPADLLADSGPPGRRRSRPMPWPRSSTTTSSWPSSSGPTRWCARRRRFPVDRTGRRYPWPLV